MTREYVAGTIETEAEFDTALGQLLLEAVRNDIDPRGSWVYRNRQTSNDWETVIYELDGVRSRSDRRDFENGT